MASAGKEDFLSIRLRDKPGLIKPECPNGLLTRNNFQLGRDPLMTCQSEYLGERNGVSHALIIRKLRYHPTS
jgi:hypothetical protein